MLEVCLVCLGDSVWKEVKLPVSSYGLPPQCCVADILANNEEQKIVSLSMILGMQKSNNDSFCWTCFLYYFSPQILPVKPPQLLWFKLIKTKSKENMYLGFDFSF